MCHSLLIHSPTLGYLGCSQVLAIMNKNKKKQNHFTFLLGMNECSFCSTFSPTFGGVSIVDFGYSPKCVTVPHCFNLHFPDEIQCEVSFHMIICHLYIFFNEVSVVLFIFKSGHSVSLDCVFITLSSSNLLCLAQSRSSI